MYFVFENCGNGDLATLIALRSKLPIILTSSETLPLEVARIYTAQIVQGLEYMQSLEIMHRDLKP